jgi:hypothetical protein
MLNARCRGVLPVGFPTAQHSTQQGSFPPNNYYYYYYYYYC